jgi:nickel superoxide dismutase
MIYKLIETLDKRFRFDLAHAHCDIPCGIYDPHPALIAALTVVRMIDLMTDLQNKGGSQDLAFQNSMARYISVKEEHAEKVKHEVRVIWGDYMKQPQFDKHPDTQELVHQIMMQASKARQSVDREAAVQLVESVNKFAEYFWDTKNIQTHRAKAPYAPNLEIVYPSI